MKSKKIFIWALLTSIFLMPTFSMTEETRMLKFQAEGLTWKEILSVVKKENKYGFLYFKSLCGACLKLEKDVFKNKEAIEYIETNFVSFNFDIEKMEDFTFSKNFEIEGYPTVVLINEAGKILNRIVGYWPVKEYMRRLKEALNTDIIKLRQDFLLNPNNVRTAMEYADGLYKSGFYKKANAVYAGIINKIDDDTTAIKVYKNIAYGYYYNLNMEKAVETLEKGLANNVFHDETDLIHCWLGNLLCEIRRPLEQRDYVKALKYYQMLPKRVEDFKTFNRSAEDKKTINFYFKIAKNRIPFAYLKSIDQEKTKGEISKELNIKTGQDILEELFSEAYEKKDLRKLTFLLSRGILFHEIYYYESLPWIEKAIELSEGKNSNVFFLYAIALQECGQFDKAIEIQKKYLEMKSSKTSNKFDLDLVRLAILYFQANEKKQSEKLFQELYNDAENNFDNLYRMSYLCNHYNVNTKQALLWTKRAISLSKQVSTMEESNILYLRPGQIFNIYAELLFKTGKVKEAVDAENTAIEVELVEDDIINYKKNLEKFKAAFK